MPVVPTAMRLTPSFGPDKLMTVLGRPAVCEQVAVTVVGVGDAAARAVLRVVSRCGRIEYARFPAVLGAEWGVSGDNLTCTLDLNTANLRRAFGGATCQGGTVGVRVLFETTAPDNLVGDGETDIRNWVQNPLSPVAGSSLLQAQIDILADRIETHQHDAGVEGESAFPHNNLMARDAAGAHPTIEAGVAGALAAAGAAQATAEVAGGNASAALDAVSDEAAARVAADANLTAAIALKQNKLPAVAIAALLDLTELPEEFVENQMRVKLNALQAAVKGLFQ